MSLLLPCRIWFSSTVRQIIRAPLTFFPFVIAGIADASVALRRIGKLLTSEELADPYLIDNSLDHAVEVDASFEWEATGNLEEPKSGANAEKDNGKEEKKRKRGKKHKTKKGEVLPTAGDGTANPETATPSEPEKPFELKDLKFSVPKGGFVAIVGKVGSGKVCAPLLGQCLANGIGLQSSILQALIGEMRRTAGTVGAVM
jgi:ABC-type multidrug transport system fused ATPase/permease subunit